MSLTRALTTKTRIKSRLGITTTSFDDLLDTQITGVTGMIETMTGRTFEADDFVELYNGQDVYGDKQKFLILRKAPVNTITSIEYKSGNNETPTWFELSENDYDIDMSLGIVRVYSHIPKGIQNIRVTYNAGYLIDFTDPYTSSVHTLPFDLTEVTEQVVTSLFKKRESEGKIQESFQESSISWREEMFTDEQKRIIKNYRRVDLI